MQKAPESSATPVQADNLQNEHAQPTPIQLSSSLPVSNQTSHLNTIHSPIQDQEQDSQDSQDEKYIQINTKPTHQQKQIVNVLDMIEQPPPIQKKNIKADSLEHDIKLGWIPKTQVTGPIPVSFSHDFLDAIIQEKIQQKRMLYLGYRGTNTFEIHQKFYESGNKYPFYQFHLCKSQFLERFFKKYYSGYEFNSDRKVGMVTEEQKPEPEEGQSKQQIQQPIRLPRNLIFDSEFEGGNLDAVYFQDDQYRLLIRVDSNTKGHCNYYNFKIHCLKTGLYRFRIMNMSKKKSLYERGLKPYIKILNPKNKQIDEWQQRDESICPKVKFSPSPFNEFLQDGGQFYSLKFQLQLKNQTHYQICYNIPYTYSELIQMMANIRENKNLHVNKLGYSLSGVEIPIFTICQNEDSKEKQEEEQMKKEENDNYFVVITGRIHPGESNGSHIVNGLVKFLLNDNAEYKRLKRNIVFKVIPMLNPDGVICGNTRTGFAGKDLNRKFSGKVEFIFPEVNNIKDYVMKLKEKHGKKLLFVIDIHGHSNRKGSFFFGPEFPILDEEYTKCRLLPRLYAARSEAFRYYSCKFKISSGKEATSRGFFNSNGVRTYTHQTSIHSYYDFKERKDLAFTRKTLENLGKDLALAILDYIEKMRIHAARLKAQLKNPNTKKQPAKQAPEILIDELKQEERDSDKMPSEKADSESQGDDIDEKELNVFYQKINQNREYFYEEILKNMNNSKDSNPSPIKEKKNKQKQIDKQKEKEKEILAKKEMEKKQKPKWTTKVAYTPKKTLFDEYSKPLVSKSTNFRTTNSIVPKFKSSGSPQAILKRQKEQKETQDLLMSFQRVKLQGSSNRIIYSVPNIKWDYSLPKNSLEAMPNNQIYRYDLNDYSHVEFQHKKDRIKQTKYFANAESIQRQPQREDRQPKINREMLQQLLLPASNVVITKDKIINQSKLLPFKEQSQKAQKIQPQNEKLFSIHDPKKGMSLAQMKRRASIMGDFKKQPIDTEIRPHAQTKKQEYLCKKWEKEIVLKTKRSFSLSNKVPFSDSKGVVPIVNVGKNIGLEVNKNLMYDERQSSELIKESESPYKKEILPKISLTKKDIIVIKNSDTYTF